MEIQRKGNGGSVNIHFHSEEELIRLFDLLLSLKEPEPGSEPEESII